MIDVLEVSNEHLSTQIQIIHEKMKYIDKRIHNHMMSPKYISPSKVIVDPEVKCKLFTLLFGTKIFYFRIRIED